MNSSRTTSISGSRQPRVSAALALAVAVCFGSAAPALAAIAPQGPLAQTIAQAKDPSGVIQAYAAATAAEPANTNIEEVYLQRMVDFGLPEMADAQAADLTKRVPQDGLPWAVAAYMDAKRGQNAQAVKEIQTAVRAAPDDPFVLRTAGQMVAWFDYRADKAQLTAETQQAFMDLRGTVNGQVVFADAYFAASTQFQEMAAAEAAQPVPQAAAQWAAPQAPVYSPVVELPSYQSPTYAVSPYYSPDLYVSPYPYWDNTPWWPSYGFVIIGINRRGDGDHDRDDRRDNRSGFDRSGTSRIPTGGVNGAPSTITGGWSRSADGGRMEFPSAASSSTRIRSFSPPSAPMPTITRAPSIGSIGAPRLSTPGFSGGGIPGGMRGGSIGGDARGGASPMGGGMRGGGGRR